MATTTTKKKTSRYGMVIDVDRCTGCGACMVACAAENNCAPAPEKATDRTGITPMRVHAVSNGAQGTDRKVRFLPVLCMQCDQETPCQTVCPQQAVELDKASGIVFQMQQRCLGCRYCMTACPYHARYFNWWDPAWPPGMEKTLNPGVSPRMRGVVEKCNFCHARLHAATERAAAAGRKEIDPADYVPACVESCPTRAIVFGDLNDPESEASKQSKSAESFRLLARLGTGPKVYYRSQQPWMRALADRGGAAPKNGSAEVRRG
jgi:molybdopterin-containing oxidoreductase family iron-sulfur binding subunit